MLALTALLFGPAQAEPLRGAPPAPATQAISAPPARDAADQILRSRGTPSGRSAAASRGPAGDAPAPTQAPAQPAASR
jgi:hypothetical protein